MHDLGHVDARRRMWLALILVLAADYLALGLASVGQARVLGIAGGVLIVAAFIAATASTPGPTVALAVLGATPLAVTTWWSIVTPVLATVTITTTLAVARRLHREQCAQLLTGRGRLRGIRHASGSATFPTTGSHAHPAPLLEHLGHEIGIMLVAQPSRDGRAPLPGG